MGISGKVFDFFKFKQAHGSSCVSVIPLNIDFCCGLSSVPQDLLNLLEVHFLQVVEVFCDSVSDVMISERFHFCIFAKISKELMPGDKFLSIVSCFRVHMAEYIKA